MRQNRHVTFLPGTISAHPSLTHANSVYTGDGLQFGQIEHARAARAPPARLLRVDCFHPQPTLRGTLLQLSAYWQR